MVSDKHQNLLIDLDSPYMEDLGTLRKTEKDVPANRGGADKQVLDIFLTLVAMVEFLKFYILTKYYLQENHKV